MAEFAQGGFIPAPIGGSPHRVHPDECIVRAADVRAGRIVCSRPGHPTATSDCAAKAGHGLPS